MSVVFIISIIIDIHGNRFEKYTLLSKIHENVDMVLGIKNVFELEGVINAQECCFSFWIDQCPYSWKKHSIETKRTEIDESGSIIFGQISGLAIIKLLDKLT